MTKHCIHGLSVDPAKGGDNVCLTCISPAGSRHPEKEGLERLVKWVLDLGLATGHADTEECLLSEVGAQIEEMSDKLHKIRQWTVAYPVSVFPEPDFKKAAKVLKENGMTLDSISASNMRHVLGGIKKILDS